MSTLGVILGSLVLLTPLFFLLKVWIEDLQYKNEMKKPEHQKYYFIKNCQADPIPEYSDDYEGFPGDKQMVENLSKEIGITKQIATYVVGVIHIGLDHTWGMEEHLATIQRALLEQYGAASVIKYSIILGLFTQYGIISSEEAKEYSKILQDIVISIQNDKQKLSR